MARCKSRYSRHTIMANSGFGPVKVIKTGEKRLSIVEQYTMTVEEAMKCYKNGLAITTA